MKMTDPSCTWVLCVLCDLLYKPLRIKGSVLCPLFRDLGMTAGQLEGNRYGPSKRPMPSKASLIESFS